MALVLRVLLVVEVDVSPGLPGCVVWVARVLLGCVA